MVAEDLTGKGLPEAMKKRHSHGATDPIRRFVRVQGMAPIRQIDVIEAHEFRYSRQKPSHEVEFTQAPAGKQPGEDLHTVRLQQVDGNIAWSLPIWFTTP